MSEEPNGYSESPDHTRVSGALTQHTPSYWRLALPALGVRYGATFFQDISQNTHASGSKHAKWFDTAAGLWMLAVTTFFAKRTITDMEHMFAETLAYEFDKKPSDIGVFDIMRSQNKVVAKARRNFGIYNGIRAAVNSSFFASWLPIRPFGVKSWKKFSETSALNLGMGVNSVYLVAEVLGRDRTFFELAQNFADSKLNQQNALGDSIKATDLIHLYERNAADNDPEHAFRGHVGTPVWKNSQVIFERMADLMNRSYQYQPQGERAHFTLPKLLYLLGNNLIQPQKVEESLAYVDIADRYGIKAVQQVVRQLRDGAALADVLKKYPLAEPALPDAGLAESRHAEKEQAPVAYAERAAKDKSGGASPTIV